MASSFATNTVKAPKGIRPCTKCFHSLLLRSMKNISQKIHGSTRCDKLTTSRPRHHVQPNEIQHRCHSPHRHWPGADILSPTNGCNVRYYTMESAPAKAQACDVSLSRRLYQRAKSKDSRCKEACQERATA